MSKTYTINSVTYKKTPTNDFDQYGRRKWNTEKKGTKPIANTSWKDLKTTTINKAKQSKASGKNNYFVNLEDKYTVNRRKVLRSVTRINPDGSRDVTYFN